jgi:hypothetical protein
MRLGTRPPILDGPRYAPWGVYDLARLVTKAGLPRISENQSDLLRSPVTDDIEAG